MERAEQKICQNEPIQIESQAAMGLLGTSNIHEIRAPWTSE